MSLQSVTTDHDPLRYIANYMHKKPPLLLDTYGSNFYVVKSNTSHENMLGQPTWTYDRL